MSIRERFKGLSKYIAATSFLAMEVFAFIAFSFGANFILYGSLTLALMISLIIFSLAEIKKRGISDFVFLLFPLFIFGIVTALGVYMRGHQSIGDFSIAELVFIPISLLSTAICGYLLAINKTFNIKIFLIVVYGALSLLVLINLIANIVNFGAFYPIIYRNFFMYYGGKRSDVPVDEMAYALEGLKIVEVKMSHYVLYPTMLLTSALMLFKVSPKTQKKEFFVFLGYALVGLVALILVPSKIGLFSIVVLLIIAGSMFLCYKFPKSRKILKDVLIVLIALAVALFIVILINNQSIFSGVSENIASNSTLNRIFNTNGYIKKYNVMLTDVLGKNFLGFAVHYITETLYDVSVSSGSIFFDTFMTSGVPGVITMSIVVIFGLKCFKKYFKEDTSEDRVKATLLAFVLFYFLYAALFYDAEYGVYYYLNTPYFMSSVFILVLFIISYVVSRRYLVADKPAPEAEEEKEPVQEGRIESPKEEKPEPKVEAKAEEEKEVYIDEI